MQAEAIISENPQVTTPNVFCFTNVQHEPFDDCASTDVDTSFINHFQNGLTDKWQATFRRMGKQCAMTAYIWIEAIRHGLHAAAEPIDSKDLASYAEQLGYATSNDHRRSAHAYECGLKLLHAYEVLSTVHKTSSIVVKTWKEAAKGCLFRPFDEVLEVVTNWLRPRIEQACYPGYSPSRKEADPDPVRCNLQVQHFVGEAGYSAREAEEIVLDLAANLRPTRDPAVEHRAARRSAVKRHQTAADLRESEQATPLAEGWTFFKYSDFDAARYRGAVESIPEARKWSQAQWMAFLGVSKGTLRMLRARAGLLSKEQIKHLPLSSTNDVQGKVRDFCRKVRGKAISLEITDPATQKTYDPIPYSVQAAQDHLRAGRGVVVFVQVASLTEIDPDGPRPMPRPHKAANLPRDEEKREKQPRPFKPYYGPGFSKRWLWSQIILNMIASGFREEDVRDLSLEEAIAIARDPILSQAVRKLGRADVFGDRRTMPLPSERSPFHDAQGNLDLRNFWDDYEHVYAQKLAAR